LKPDQDNIGSLERTDKMQKFRVPDGPHVDHVIVIGDLDIRIRIRRHKIGKGVQVLKDAELNKNPDSD